MAMKNSTRKPSVADRIVQRMRGFTEALERGEAISEKFTCRRIVLDLEPTSYNAAQVKKTRELLGASQGVFARLLGVSVKTVRAWEQGVNPPNPMACRFMDEIRRQPAYWINRLKEAVVAR